MLLSLQGFCIQSVCRPDICKKLIPNQKKYRNKGEKQASQDGIGFLPEKIPSHYR